MLRRLHAQGAAGDVDEGGALEWRLEQHLAEGALDGVVVADHHAVLDVLGRHLDQRQGGVLGLVDVLQELVAVEQAQAGAEEQQHGQAEDGEHAPDQGARQQRCGNGKKRGKGMGVPAGQRRLIGAPA
jgi:hypothetical protein